MTKTRERRAGKTASLTRRRQMSSIRAMEAMAMTFLHRLRAEHPDFLTQPGAVLFPKRIFITEEGAAPLPEGQSLEYLELVRQQWLQAWSEEPAVNPADNLSASIRLLQHTVLDAHVLERRLLQRLELLK